MVEREGEEGICPMYASQSFCDTQACHSSEIYVSSWRRIPIAFINIPFFDYPTRENSCTWIQGFSGAAMETSWERENVNFTGVQHSSDGDNGNRATAAEMSLPTLLKFKRRQRIIKHMLTLILDRVLLEAKRAGSLPADIDSSYDITFPEIDSGEHHALAEGMSWLVPALQVAKQQGWVSDETAMRIMFEYCGEEIDVHEERARISQQPPSK